MLREAVTSPRLIVDDSRAPFPPDYLAQLTGYLAAQRRADAVKFWFRQVGVPASVLVVMRLMPAWTTFQEIAHTLPYDGAIMAGLLNGGPLPDNRWNTVDAPTLAIVGGKEQTMDAARRLSPGECPAERQTSRPARPDSRGQARCPGSST